MSQVYLSAAFSCAKNRAKPDLLQGKDLLFARMAW